jgi:hypothetical protein
LFGEDKISEQLMEQDRQSADDQFARPAQYGELVAAVAGTLSWLYILATQGTLLAIETLWILAIVLPLGAWSLLMRLHFSDTRLGLTIGPWRRYVDLGALESVRWKMTGGWRSRGTILVLDRYGHRVPIYVGRFKRGGEWGPLLIEAAAASGATIDERARSFLRNAGSADRS